MDKIILNQLKLRPIIGTLPQERLHRQQITATLTLELDLSRAAQSDDLTDTIDYSAIEKAVVQLADQTQFKLLEALAGAILDQVYQLTSEVQKAVIRLEKPAGSSYGRSVIVELSRTRA